MRDETRKQIERYEQECTRLSEIRGAGESFTLSMILRPIVYLLADIADSLNALAERHGDK